MMKVRQPAVMAKKKIHKAQTTVSTPAYARNNISASRAAFWAHIYALRDKNDSEDADLGRSWPLEEWLELQRRKTAQWKADKRVEALGLRNRGTKIRFAIHKGGWASNSITRGLKKRRLVRNEKGDLVLTKEVHLCFHWRGKIADERIIDVEVEN